MKLKNQRLYQGKMLMPCLAVLLLVYTSLQA